MPINLKKTSIIGASLIVVGLALGYVGYKSGAVTAMSWEGGPHLIKTVSKTKTFDASNLKNLNIQANNYKIELNNKGTSDKVGVSMTYDGKAIPNVTVSGDSLKIDVKDTSNYNFGIGFFNGAEARKITISLPDKVYQDIVITTGNGAVKAIGVDAKTIGVSSDNGAVEIRNGKLTGLNISADNGALKLSDVKLDTLLAELNNGAVKANNVTVENGGQVTADNGMIVFDGLTTPSLSASAGNGVVNVDGKSFGTKYEKIQEGKKPLNLHTTSGAIEIK